MNILLRQQPSIVLISWPNTWLHGILPVSSQSWYRWISEQKGRIEKIRNHMKNMHESSAATLRVLPCLWPRDFFSTPFFLTFSAGWLLFIHPLSRLSAPLCLLFGFSQLLSWYLCVPLPIFWCVSFICTCLCSISSYRVLSRRLGSSATPGSCGTVAVAMCIYSATQKGSKLKMSWPRFQN